MIPDGPNATQAVRDLTVGPLSAGTNTKDETAPGPRVAQSPYDPARDREEMRGKIALWLVTSLLMIVYAALIIAVVTAIACSTKESCSTETSNLAAAKTIVETLLTPLVGLVGAVAGFYFGEKSGKAAG